MSLRLWCLALLLGLGLMLPTRADAQAAPKKDDPAAKKDDAKKDDAKKDDAKKGDAKKGDAMMKKDDKKDPKSDKDKKPAFRDIGSITGTVTQLGEGGQTLTVRVVGVTPTWVQAYDYRYNRWRVNPNYNRPNVSTNDFDVILADECKVRIPAKVEYDEKGRPKPPPKKDPKEDPDYKLDGYKGEPSDLAKDQTVTVVFGISNDPKNPQILATKIFVLRDKPGFKKGDDR